MWRNSREITMEYTSLREANIFFSLLFLTQLLCSLNLTHQLCQSISLNYHSQDFRHWKGYITEKFQVQMALLSHLTLMINKLLSKVAISFQFLMMPIWMDFLKHLWLNLWLRTLAIQIMIMNLLLLLKMLTNLKEMPMEFISVKLANEFSNVVPHKKYNLSQLPKLQQS